MIFQQTKIFRNKLKLIDKTLADNLVVLYLDCGGNLAPMAERSFPFSERAM